MTALALLENRNGQEIRTLGNSRIVQASVFAPFIGYLVIFNDYVVHIFDISAAPFFGIENIDFRLRLGMTYLGFVFVGGGTIAFQLLCPQVVKKYADEEDYVARSLSYHTRRDLISMATELASSANAKRAEIGGELVEGWRQIRTFDPSEINLPGHVSSIQEENVRNKGIDTMRSYYMVNNLYAKRKGLYLSLIVYGIGFTLLAIPSIRFMWRVALAIFAGVR